MMGASATCLASNTHHNRPASHTWVKRSLHQLPNCGVADLSGGSSPISSIAFLDTPGGRLVDTIRLFGKVVAVGVEKRTGAAPFADGFIFTRATFSFQVFHVAQFSQRPRRSSIFQGTRSFGRSRLPVENSRMGKPRPCGR